MKHLDTTLQLFDAGERVPWSVMEIRGDGFHAPTFTFGVRTAIVMVDSDRYLLPLESGRSILNIDGYGGHVSVNGRGIHLPGQTAWHMWGFWRRLLECWRLMTAQRFKGNAS